MAEASAEQKPKKKRAIGKLLLLVINLLLFASGAGFFVLTKFGIINSPFSSAPTAFSEPAVGNAAKAPAAAPPPAADLIAMRLRPFVINLSGDHGRRYLRLVLELSVHGHKAKDAIEEQQTKLRDRLIFLLSAKSFDDISTVQGKYQLQNEILSTINEVSGPSLAERVYFVEFIVQ